MSKAKLLWVDLEMTGLSPDDDRILEVAMIATDWDFKTIATYEAIKKVGPELIKKQMFGGQAKSFWDKYPEVRQSLVDQNETGKNGRTVENEMLAFVEEYFDGEKQVILAGNSIHQDRKFIDNEWPRFAAKLHYRMLDVSAWKIVFEGKYRKRFTKPETHRALSDIQGSIEELQYYLKKVKI